mmetsp:Transcript_35197/g.56914  ORF Transcript_35197/g.56914 Transcript_35197/m.56914 type:complete len:128 (-) Transcript_35197:1893-2276(-)
MAPAPTSTASCPMQMQEARLGSAGFNLDRPHGRGTELRKRLSGAFFPQEQSTLTCLSGKCTLRTNSKELTHRADPPTGTTGPKRFPFNNFKHFLTLFSKFFASFPHGTCSLSVSRPYLALDGIYHQL